MRPRFDSRPLVLRRKYTATMRGTVILDWRTQIQHSLHLFCVISSSVIARNVANQQILDAVGPHVLGQLYIAVALVAGLGVAALGWLGRERDTRRLTRGVQLSVVVLNLAAFLMPAGLPGAAIATYVLMDLAFAVMLLTFGLLLGANLGPREARKVAAYVGAGGILGGLVAGGILSMGALLLGSRPLFLISAGLAALPVFWLPEPSLFSSQHTSSRVAPVRDRGEVPALSPYGRWVAAGTVLMVAATTLIDYQYRFATAQHYDADKMTAFFGFVVISAGLATILFQFTLLDFLLNRLGVFGTAILMPAGLIACLVTFGLAPMLATLVLLKTVDSGTNMSLQQATGSLLLAPLNPRMRSVWQGRIDGLAKRGGQVLTGAFLALFPWPPDRVLPIALVLCAMWIATLLVTRKRYIRLLTEMLGAPTRDDLQLSVLDGASLRLLESELANSSPARAAVILDLLEQAEHRAPEHLLQKLVEADPNGLSALRVVDHLATVGDHQALLTFSRSPHVKMSSAALLALADLDPRAADLRSRQILLASHMAEALVATAAGLLAERDPEALRLAQRLAKSGQKPTRLALAQALGRSEPGGSTALMDLVCLLAADRDVGVARIALEAMGRHPSERAATVALQALRQRELRGAAMRAMAEIGNPVVSLITEELRRHSADAAVASALTWTLGRICSATGVAALVEALTAPVVQVRLGAAVALCAIRRRHPSLELPLEQIASCCAKEIAEFSRLRSASLAPFPDTPAGSLLQRAFKQRVQASLETLFRMLSLQYDEAAMQGAFQAITTSDTRKRQIALELLDTILDRSLSDALNEAMGGMRSKPRLQADVLPVLVEVAEQADPFLASLAAAVLLDVPHGASARKDATPTGVTMAQTLVKQILELQSLALFAQTSAEDLAEVAALVGSRRLNRGTMIFREGDRPDAMYLVRSGEVTLSRSSTTLDRVGPGEAFGIVAVLDQLPREVSATVSKDASLLVLRGDDLLQLLADRPLLMHSVFRALTSSIRSNLEGRALGKKPEEWSW